jgi:hypothetical protein
MEIDSAGVGTCCTLYLAFGTRDDRSLPYASRPRNAALNIDGWYYVTTFDRAEMNKEQLGNFVSRFNSDNSLSRI